MLNARYGDNPQFEDYKPYIMELFNGLSNAEKAEFFRKEDKLIRELWEYEYKLNLQEYTEFAVSNEFDLLVSKLEQYYAHDADRLRWVRIRSERNRMFQYNYEQYS